jgi:hypothetical protein
MMPLLSAMQYPYLGADVEESKKETKNNNSSSNLTIIYCRSPWGRWSRNNKWMAQGAGTWDWLVDRK